MADDTYNSNSFVTAKTTFNQKRADPFSDPFPMPTPERSTHHSQREKFSRSSTLNSQLSDNNPPKSSIIEDTELKNVQKHDTYDLVITSHTHENVSTLASSSSVESADAVKENILPNNYIQEQTDQTQFNNIVEYRSEKVRALYDYNPNEDDELTLVKGTFYYY